MSDEIIHIEGENLPSAKQDFDADDLIRQYLADTQNLSKTSKDRYSKSLKRYFEWVKGSPYQLQNITLTELLIYRKFLETSHNRYGDLLSTFTVNAYLVAVKLFYEWANGKGLMINPAAALKAPKRETKFKRLPLFPEQIKKLLDHLKKTSLRDYTMISVMYYCGGLRDIEVSRLDFGDIQMKYSPKQQKDVRVVLIQGKGKKEKDRMVKMRDEEYKLICEYMGDRVKNGPTEPIFVSESAFQKKDITTRLTPDTISRTAKAALKAIGLNNKQYTAHSIRHSAATNALRAGASLADVQKMLRHADSKTTEGYTHTLEEEETLNNSAQDNL
ncbi:MAG TPA: tyrosine-type recombinase/integrase [Bacteroidia bacterium]|nr:tyrosine-type recombinase/integrase [Bacteroidia bacterium]